MKVVFIEGHTNARVREFVAERLGTEDVRYVGYCQEGGWWSQMAYTGTDEVLESDDLRKIGLDVFSIEDKEFRDNPVAIVYEAPGHKLALDIDVHVQYEDEYNVYGKPFNIAGWVFGGNDDDIEDVYQD